MLHDCNKCDIQFTWDEKDCIFYANCPNCQQVYRVINDSWWTGVDYQPIKYLEIVRDESLSSN
jgi:hypothetical protein